MTDNRKPFDLERAKSGDPIETRDGKRAVFGGYNPDAGAHCVAIWIGGALISVRKNGRWGHEDDGPENPADIFMASKKVTVWVNVYTEANWVHKFSGFFHTNKIDAEKMAGGANFVGTYPLEIDVP